MDLSKIFELFNEKEEVENEDENPYVDFKSSPLYWVGMYKKLVLNNSNFNKKIVKFFKDSDDDLDVDEMSEAGEWITYQRAWEYIKDINLKNENHIKIIKRYSDEYLETSLKLGISYFEGKEIYENCALLKGVLDVVENIEE
tara:strand:+ start:2410 stop:2835 length:426 start_codon:yes stop_codon:yes gene_type:complete